MRKFLLMLVAFTATQLFAQSAQKDPYQKTFIQNTHYQPDASVQAQMRNSAAWQNFIAEHGNWWVEFNETTGMPHRAYGKPFSVSGSTPEEKAFTFFSNALSPFNSPNNELVVKNINTSDKYNYVTLKQQYKGLDVLWSEATVRLSLDGNVVMFGLDTYNDITANITPGISAEGIKDFASADFAITVNSVDVSGLKILPLLSGEAGKYTFKLVYELYVNTVDHENLPGKYYSLVDANTGEVYYRQNFVKACGAPMMSATLQANAEISDNPLLPTVNRGLPYLKVTIDGDDYYTNFDGFLTVNFITEPTAATVSLDGLYAKVFEGGFGTDMETVDITIEPGDNVIEFDDISDALTSEVSAYYHQNVVHDYMKENWPAFEDLDFDQLIRVERTDGTCNAFYDGSSTNFYANGGGCPSTALFDDVVMHEYGHGINFDLYAWLGGTLFNGAMQEGYADLWAIANTHNPVLGQGFSGGSSTYVRKYDGDPKVYPQDLQGEAHGDGEIIAGAWWDVAVNFGDDVDAMALLWNATHNATIDGESGTEGTIYTDVLVEALLADDDNADLSDGTPRFTEITNAFCKHGITLIGQVGVENEKVTTVAADEPIIFDQDFIINYPLNAGDVLMVYKTSTSGIWNTAIMTYISGTTFEASLPAQPAGTVIDYYFSISDVNGCQGSTIPAEADLATEPNIGYHIIVGVNLQHTEDFDNTFGAWDFDPFGTDEATTGQWDVNEPIESFDPSIGTQLQTDKDHTDGSSNLCAFTGNSFTENSPGDNDVDGGETTFRTPIFDMTDYVDPSISYWRIYSNSYPTSANPGNDVWQVRITNDMVNWITVERTHTDDNQWRSNAFRVRDFVEPTSTVALIFIAQDSVIPSDPLGFEGGSLVEAALDDLQIWDASEPDTANSVDELTDFMFGIFPNPATDHVNIYLDNSSSEITISILNGLGEIMLSKIVEAAESRNITLNTKDLAAGVYTVNCKTDHGYINKRLVINR